MAATALIIAIVVLVYSALQTDLARKCAAKGAVSKSESNMLQYINVTMLALSAAAVLYLGYHMFAPHSLKQAIGQHF